MGGCGRAAKLQSEVGGTGRVVRGLVSRGNPVAEQHLAVGAQGDEPGARAWLRYGQYRLAHSLEGDPWATWKYIEEALAAAE